MEALVSVIVPIYNVEKYLDQCIDSIVHQTYSNLEIILVDDGATDSCPQKCDLWKEKDNRISVIHKKNAGLGFARNSGLEMASGEYVMYIDSDDYISGNMIERLTAVAEQTKSDTVFCGLKRVYPDGTEAAIPASYNDQTFERGEIIDKVLLEMVGSLPESQEDANLFMSVWHALYSMEIIRKYAVRFPSERQIMCEDIIYHIDYLRRAQRVTCIADPLYFYRVNPKSLSRVYDSMRFERQKVLSQEIRTRLCEFVPADKVNLREDRRFLGGVRAQMLAIMKSQEKHKRQTFKAICEDAEVKRVLARYPYQRNPMRHRIFNFALKYRMSITLYLIVYCVNKQRSVSAQ